MKRIVLIGMLLLGVVVQGRSANALDEPKIGPSKDFNDLHIIVAGNPAYVDRVLNYNSLESLHIMARAQLMLQSAFCEATSPGDVVKRSRVFGGKFEFYLDNGDSTEYRLDDPNLRWDARSGYWAFRRTFSCGNIEVEIVLHRPLPHEADSSLITGLHNRYRKVMRQNPRRGEYLAVVSNIMAGWVEAANWSRTVGPDNIDILAAGTFRIAASALQGINP